MAIKNAILKMKVEGILNEIWLKSGAENIVVDQSTGETLATRLAQLGTDIEAAVAGGLKASEVQTMISTAIDNLVDGAPETMKTLGDVAEYLATHKDEYEALMAMAAGHVQYDKAQELTADQKAQARANIDAVAVSVVNELTQSLSTQVARLEGLIQANATAIAGHATEIANKVDKVEGKGLSTNDYTDADKAKLAGVAEGATKVEASAVNGSVKVNGADVQVYAHPTGAGAEHLPSGGSVGQVLRASGNGQAAWGEAIRHGASEPSDLAEGELFIQLV